MFYLIISSDIGASSSRYFEFSLCDQRRTARAQDKEKKDIFAKFTHTDVRVESECMLDIVCFVYTGINWFVWQSDIVVLFFHLWRLFMLFFYLDVIKLPVVVVCACLVKLNLEINHNGDIERCWWIEIGVS